MRPEAEDEQRIEALIAEQVHQKLQVILEGEMANALHEFVDKASPSPVPISYCLNLLAALCLLNATSSSWLAIVAVHFNSGQPPWAGQAVQCDLVRAQCYRQVKAVLP